MQVDHFDDAIGHEKYCDQVLSLRKLPQCKREKAEVESGYWSFLSGSTSITAGRIDLVL